MRAHTNTQRGFTLIELIMVIVILGIIAAMVAVFMRSPIDAYFDTARRAALADQADTATRRMARDIRKSLPNSIRVPNAQCVEFIPTRTGARYRADRDTAGGATQADNILSFAGADDRFNLLVRNTDLPADQQIQVNDHVVVYNLGIPGSDAYAGNNRSQISAVAAVGGTPSHGDETRLTITSRAFPLASGANRLHIVPGGEQVVAYVCSGGSLRRTVRTFAGAQCPATGPVLARDVSACSFVYNDSDLQRNALVQLTLTFSSAGENMSLYHEVHVNNTP